MFIDKEKYSLEVAKTNNILKTITYEYKYKGTCENAIRQYVTKKDIDKVLKDIEKMKDKKITIEISPPEKKREYRSVKIEKAVNKELVRKYGKEEYEKIIALCNEMEKERREIQELEIEKQKTKNEIKKKIQKIFETKKEIEDKIIKAEKLHTFKNRIVGYWNEKKYV
jgi:septal ring factor EnvC (AmiA/AmiB activator)